MTDLARTMYPPFPRVSIFQPRPGGVAELRAVELPAVQVWSSAGGADGPGPGHGLVCVGSELVEHVAPARRTAGAQWLGRTVARGRLVRMCPTPALGVDG